MTRRSRCQAHSWMCPTTSLLHLCLKPFKQPTSLLPWQGFHLMTNHWQNLLQEDCIPARPNGCLTWLFTSLVLEDLADMIGQSACASQKLKFAYNRDWLKKIWLAARTEKSSCLLDSIWMTKNIMTQHHITLKHITITDFSEEPQLATTSWTAISLNTGLSLKLHSPMDSEQEWQNRDSVRTETILADLCCA